MCVCIYIHLKIYLNVESYYFRFMYYFKSRCVSEITDYGSFGVTNVLFGVFSDAFFFFFFVLAK